jgi:hypothetical protein
MTSSFINRNTGPTWSRANTVSKTTFSSETTLADDNESVCYTGSGDSMSHVPRLRPHQMAGGPRYHDSEWLSAQTRSVQEQSLETSRRAIQLMVEAESSNDVSLRMINQQEGPFFFLYQWTFLFKT